nr:immunoglobulin heavy chain junction region [Macaca mulatta]MOV86830.1 immunoglobulin heavy chain junction region [Macaca mulatta]MOV87004.1 immunoglobulin heavy chain junction region [Macaca mulatta]MOV87288.1 immunoglobulin heavy chain junction region [Macaca mulatta]MOV87361.1 immunoglobulin heavy chain junction region [Macaca mulatta]
CARTLRVSALAWGDYYFDSW